MAEDGFTESGSPVAAGSSGSESGAPAADLQGTLAEVEREMIVTALQKTRGNKARAARVLGITERIMGLRVRKYGIDPQVFRAKPCGRRRETGPGKPAP